MGKFSTCLHLSIGFVVSIVLLSVQSQHGSVLSTVLNTWSPTQSPTRSPITSVPTSVPSTTKPTTAPTHRPSSVPTFSPTVHWTNVQTISTLTVTPGDASMRNMGAMSRDGNTLVAANDLGQVVFYGWSGTQFVTQGSPVTLTGAGTLTGTDAYGESFGGQLLNFAISQNGSVVYVGCLQFNVAWILWKNGATWKCSSLLHSPSQYTPIQFAAVGAVTGDGSTVFIVSPSSTTTEVFSYSFNGTAWINSGRINSGSVNSVGGTVSYYLYLSAAYNTSIVTLAVTANNYIYELNGPNAWTLMQTVTSTSPIYGNTLSSDGIELIVGDQNAFDGSFNTGAARYYKRGITSWTDVADIWPGNLYTNMFGEVAISGDGRYLVAMNVQGFTGLIYYLAPNGYYRELQPFTITGETFQTTGLCMNIDGSRFAYIGGTTIQIFTT